MSLPSRILGISPGTRKIGIAVLSQGMLLDWRIKAFNNKWSGQKLEHIIASLEAIIQNEGIEGIALKVVSGSYSKRLNEVISRIIMLAHAYAIPVQTFTLDELKGQLGQHDSKSLKADIVLPIIERHPLLSVEYKKDQENEGSYYLKIFEAIACCLSYEERTK